MSLIEEVKQRLDIVEVISEYLPLQKAGRSFKALCPFHSEKTPSFFVFPEQQSWRCFGACATGGDVFSFVMKKEGIGFGEALRLLAHRSGVSITTEVVSDGAKSKAHHLETMNRLATEYYHDNLLHSTETEFAREYLLSRGISYESIVNFSLGYSSRGKDLLLDHLHRLGYEPDELVSAGLVIKKETGKYRDRFWGRLMFPIRDVKGRVVGFGARTMDDSPPKYLNSPQTHLFDKSSTLYGINYARDSIRRNDLAVIVEGYMDVIMAHQNSFDNVVASMGTSLTEKQIGVLKGISRNITLALDADAAGEMATLRGIETAYQSLDYKVTPVLSSQGIVRYENSLDAEIRIISLPQGKDPDEVIKQDPQEWKLLVESAPTVIDYTFSMVTAGQDLAKLETRSSVVNKVIPLIAEIKDKVRRSYYLQKLARLVNVDERSLVEIMRQAQTLRKRSPSGVGKLSANHPGVSITKKAQETLPVMGISNSLDRYCLSLLLRNPVLKNHIDTLSPEYFEGSENRELFRAWYEYDDIEELRVKIDDVLRDYLELLIRSEFPPMNEEERKEALDSCIIRLKERQLRGLLKVSEETLTAEAQSAGASTQVELNKQLREIFHHKAAGKNAERDNF